VYNSRFKFTAGKLRSKWTGPFVITKVSPYGAVELLDPQTSTEFKVNGHRVKIYEGGIVPTQKEKMFCIDG
ncbi:hypothetical protein A2U01_0092694, partial [Trifolium medium]|nr:hypothetical protein [Trifolium medium]